MRIDRSGLGILATDTTGLPVLSIESAVTRPLDVSQLRSMSAGQRSLYRLEWPELPRQSTLGPLRVAVLGSAEPSLGADRHADLAALQKTIDDGAEAPDVVLASVEVAERAVPGELHASASEVLPLLQDWIADDRLEAARLTVLTEGAVNTAAQEGADPLGASVWGLVRSAQSEHPDRFALIDSDGNRASSEALASALAVGADEGQLAIREGRLLTPRLAPAGVAEDTAPPFDSDATVLITGGTGGIGAVLARHLASAHGVRHLILASRRGEEAEGTDALAAELRQLGAEVTIAACDVSQREQLEKLIDAIPAEHPLGTAIHLAGVLDDGVLESLDPERLQRVFAAKADAAWHLHELTAERGGAELILFSSAAGTLGNPGQGNYAAANAFLDALAARRRAEGLPATAMIWGAWDVESRMASALEEGDLRRFARRGFVPIGPGQGMELFDAARDLDEAQAVPLALDRAALRAQASAGLLPAVLRGIVRVPARREQQGGSLEERLAGVAADEREGVVLALVRSHAATILGHAAGDAVDPDLAFQELGFDSLGAVELRNRLSVATGLRLPPTLIFDYPSPRALAAHLLAQGSPGEPGAGTDPVEAEFRQALARVPLARLRSAGLIEALAEVVGVDAMGAAESSSVEQIDAMEIEELVERTLEREVPAGDVGGGA